MDSKSEFKSGNPRSFLGGGEYEFAFQCFSGSNEENMGRQQKEEVL